jgi:spermidine synthase
MHALGKHLIIELYECPALVLDDVSAVEKIMSDAALFVGATIIGKMFHHFSPYGVSGVVVIQESHLAIHTWPEWGFASIDVFTCGEEIDPWNAYLFLKEHLQAVHGSAMEMRRGETRLLTHQDYTPEQQRSNVLPSEVWLTERNEQMATSFKRQGQPLFKGRSPFQNIEVVEMQSYGKSLFLDQKIVLTENDEAAYHEMLVHLPMFEHGRAKRVLILGGGDGGALRQVCRHTDISRIVLVEMDKLVLEVSRQYLDFLSEVWLDSRLTLVVGSAESYLEKCEASAFDVLIVDAAQSDRSTFFSAAQYAQMHSLLAPDGILVLPTHSPSLKPEMLLENGQLLASIFEYVRPYLAHIPTYPTGLCSFLMAQKRPSQVQQTDIELFVEAQKLHYYNADMHQAAQVLPTFLRQLWKAAQSSKA